MKKNLIFLVLLSIVLLTGCADVQHVEKCVTGYQYGFFSGIWHGMIAPISFIGSLFYDDVAVWAVNNNGGLYALGFLLGVGALGGSVRYTVKRR